MTTPKMNANDFVFPLVFSILFTVSLFQQMRPVHADTVIESFEDPSMHVENPNNKCEPIMIKICKNIEYNHTIMPNLLGHTKQDAADIDSYQFAPLVKVGCSQHMKLFLCSIYAPVCTVLDRPIPPCRSLCQYSRKGCENLMNKFGYQWPENFDCKLFPESGKNVLCVGEDPRHKNPNEIFDSSELGSLGGEDVSQHSGVRNYPYPDPYGSSNDLSFGSGKPKTHELTFACPLNFAVPKGFDYVFRIQGKEHLNCGMPCEGVLFNADDRHIIRCWTGLWAAIGLVSSLFALVTLSIEKTRFEYPERPIIFLTVCYVVVSSVYFLGYFLGDSASCNAPFAPPGGHTNIQMVRTITQGNKLEHCTLIFMTLYYFVMANAMWWVVLTVSWFLSAALKWSQEAIESISHYFHLIAWAVPGLLTLSVLVTNKVEGDILTGVCFVGNWNRTYLVSFVLVPLSICLLLSTIFLLLGFASLWRVRTIMKGTFNTADLHKLDKLMFKVGLFSLFYLLPSAVLIGCYVYEHKNIDAFLMHWLSDVCRKPDFGIPCPPRFAPGYAPSDFVMPAKAELPIYLTKYLTILLPAITSGLCILSEETVNSWIQIFKKVFCIRKRAVYV